MPLSAAPDAGIIGSAFYVMEMVEGRIFWDATIPGVSNAERVRILPELIQLAWEQAAKAEP